MSRERNDSVLGIWRWCFHGFYGGAFLCSLPLMAVVVIGMVLADHGPGCPAVLVFVSLALLIATALFGVLIAVEGLALIWVLSAVPCADCADWVYARRSVRAGAGLRNAGCSWLVAEWIRFFRHGRGGVVSYFRQWASMTLNGALWSFGARVGWYNEFMWRARRRAEKEGLSWD